MARRRIAVAGETTNAVIYCRVSTVEQARDGISLDAQESKCSALCTLRGLTVVAVHKDAGLSGRSEVASRPGLTAAIAACRETGAILVVYSVSRVARSQRILWTMIDPARGDSIGLISATEPFDTSTPMGRAMLGMIGVWSQLEADLVSERTIDALAQLKANGKKLGQVRMAVLVPDAVARIRELRDVEGLSLRDIVKTMNDSGTKGANGGRWWVRSVVAALEQSKPIQ